MAHDVRRRALLMAVGTAVSEAREQAGLTQRELADRTDGRVSRAVVANLESGRQRVALDQLFDLAEALDLPPSDLIPDPAILPRRESSREGQLAGDSGADEFLAGLGRPRRTWIPTGDGDR